ncbi:P-loop containing nucleoside triphosphate hydrolases superfamily protein, partial [Striga hermonthica]
IYKFDHHGTRLGSRIHHRSQMVLVLWPSSTKSLYSSYGTVILNSDGEKRELCLIYNMQRFIVFIYFFFNKKQNIFILWVQKLENGILSSLSADNESCSASESPASSSKSSQRKVMFSDTKDASRKSIGRKVDGISTAVSFPERTQAGDLISIAGGMRRLPPSGSTITDQMELFREQIKMLAGEVALSTSSLKRLSEQAAKAPGDSKLQEKVQKLKDEIREKKHQIGVLEQRMIGSVEMSPYGSSIVEMSQALSRFAAELNEKTFELEIKSADNRVLQEQLQEKTVENTEMQETINLLKQQIESLMSNKNSRTTDSMTGLNSFEESSDITNERGSEINSFEYLYENTPTSVGSMKRVFNHEDATDCNRTSKLLLQAAEIESLKHDNIKISERNDELEIHCQKQIKEASYAKELAAAAAVELRNLAHEVTKLSYENTRLAAELASAKDSRCKARQNGTRPARKHHEQDRFLSAEEFELELNARYQREASLVAALSERDNIEADLRRRLDEAMKHEEKLENELANMWVLVAKTRSKSFAGPYEISNEESETAVEYGVLE